MEKDFDIWNSEKKIVNRKIVNRDLFFHAREIWWCSVGLNIGVEADGKNENFERPVLIIKKFNAEMVWVLPLTTKEKQDRFHFRIQAGPTGSSVVLSQIKSISTKRLLRKMDNVLEIEFVEIISRLQKFLAIENPLSGVISEAEATNNKIISQFKNESNGL